MSREMKYSGNKWIGQIPESWGVERIKTIFRERTELSEDGSETLLSVSEYYGVANRSEKVSDGEFVSRAESLIGYKKCYKGDLVSNIMLAWKGSMGITEYDGIVSPAYCVYEPSKLVYPRYYHYLFRTTLYTSIFRLYSKGIIDSRLRLYSPYFFDIKAIIPSNSEQQKIAEFLDKKCGEVDEMIALQEQIIEELKAYKQSVITEAVTKGLNPNVPMKDRGIEWIGEIPRHWMVSRLKAVLLKIESGVSVNAGGDFSNDRNKYVLKTSCVSRNVFIHTECKKVEEYDLHRVSCPVKADTLIVSRMNTPELVGTCGYCKNDIYNVFLPDRLWQVSLIEGMLTKYFWYLLIGNTTRNYLSSLSTGTSSSMQNISQPQFGNTPITIPPLAEQEAIADYLDNKCGDIDALIAIKQQKIESLKEYKKSIIYEYVTGKKEVV